MTAGRRYPPAVAWIALATAMVAASRFAGDALLPCPVACQGGAAYQRLLGVPLHVLATVLLLALALLAWWRRPAATVAAWGAAGGAVYFLWLSWRLGLVCPYCLAVHVGVLATATASWRWPLPWRWRGACAALAFLGLHFAYHPQVMRDGPALAAAPPAPVDPEQLSEIEALRTAGDPAAPAVVELAIDVFCPHCAAAHGPLLEALQPLVEAGRVRVVQRFLIRRSTPAAAGIVARILSARDAAQSARLLAVLLGTFEDRTWEDVRPLAAAVTDPAELEDRLARRRAAVEALLVGDAARLAELGALATPFAALSRDGVLAGRWEGRACEPAVVAQAAGSLR